MGVDNGLCSWRLGFDGESEKEKEGSKRVKKRKESNIVTARGIDRLERGENNGDGEIQLCVG